MRFHEDQKGFTLIEVVIVTAIVAVLASLSLTMLARIKYANTEKMITSVSDAMTKAQVLAMTKETPRYLHVYKYGSDYYTCINESLTLTDGAGGNCLGSNLKIYKVIGDDATDIQISDTVQAVMSFKRDGTLRTTGSEDVRKIVVEGSYTAEIRINSKTGRHYTEKR